MDFFSWCKLSFFLFLAGASLAAAQPLFPVGEKELSPLKDMVVSYYPDCREIWLSNARHPKNTECLLSYIRSADVLLSPKESVLIENDRSGSNLAEVHLYRREKGLRYVEDKSININEKIQKAAVAKSKLSLDQMDHSYVRALKWLSESKLLVSFDGMAFNFDRPSPYLEESTALFNIKTGKVEWIKLGEAGMFPPRHDSESSN